MYQYSVFHFLFAASIALALVFVLVISIIRQRRGEIGLLRQSLPIYLGFLLMLVGNLLRGGRHDDAGTLIDFMGLVVLLIGVLRLRQWQKVRKPAA